MERTITVDKDSLLVKLRQNRDEHATDYTQGIEEYQRQASERLAALSRKVTTDPDTDLYVRDLPKPEDHTSDYDTAIQMLEWHQGDQVTLGVEDFEHFVLDNWDWKARFVASMSNYSGKFR